MAPTHFLQDLTIAPGTVVPTTLRVRESGRLLASTVEAAFSPAARKRGLLGRDGLEPGAALVIAPCSAIHTIGMRFPIDAIFVARDGRVLKIARAVRPGRFAMSLAAFAVVEMAAGEAGQRGLTVGEHLQVG